MGDVVADGVHPVDLFVLAVDESGAPLDGIEAKLSVDQGTLGVWTPLGEGLYQLPWTPPSLQQSGRAIIRAKLKTLDKVTIKRSVTLRLRPWTPASMSLEISPKALSSGKVKDASVTIALADTRSSSQVEDMQVLLSEGEILDMTHMGENRFTARYVAPDIKEPALALMTVSDRRRPGRAYGAAAIPISVLRMERLRAPAGSTVLLQLGSREFGPREVARNGRVDLEVMAEPGVRSGTLVILQDGERTEKPFEFPFEAPRRLQFIPLHQGIPTDASKPVPVRVVVFSEGGEPDSEAKLELAASTGAMDAVRYEGDGIYVAMFTADPDHEETEVVFTATLADESKQMSELKAPLTPARPMRVKVLAEPQVLNGAKELTLTAEISGADGGMLKDRSVDWNITGGQIKGEPKEVSEGRVAVQVSTYGGPLEVLATVGTGATGNPLASLLMSARKEVLPSDGISATLLTILTLDELGYPVANQTVDLVLEGGDGSLPERVSTDSNGVGQVFYTAGRQSGLIRIRAMSGAATAAVGLIQGSSKLDGIELPTAGSEAHRALEAEWVGLVGHTYVEP